MADDDGKAAQRSRALLGAGDALPRPPAMLLEPARPNIAPPPRSSLLDRVAAFLPQMEASNLTLDEHDNAGLTLENELGPTAGNAPAGEHVEMDIYCAAPPPPASEEPVDERTLRLPGHPPPRESKKARSHAPHPGITEL